MADDRGSVRRIAWRDICPWLIIFRCFRLSISVPVLLLATLGTLLTPVGWQIGEALFDEKVADIGSFVTFSEWGERGVAIWKGAAGEDPSTRLGRVLSSNVTGVYRQFVAPFAHLVIHRNELTITEAAYCLWGGMWNILVWALAAGAITRIAAVQLGREERIGFWEAIGHAGRHYVWYVIAPLFPMLGIVLICLPLAILGALMRLDAGVLIAGLLWLPVLIGGLVITMLLLGLSLGWPLMWPAISSEEGSDAFEAFSRAYAYTFQRPLHYLFFAFVTVAFGAVCWVLVSVFSTCVIEASYWGTSWGASGERIREIQSLPSENGVFFAGAFLIRLCTILVHAIAVAFNDGFFWCAATAIYLLLRREVDEADFDEVFMEEEKAKNDAASAFKPLPDR
ncbi:MAG: hypothetical protein ACC628_14885 [Pirellulaceae bacterium]